MTPPNVTDEMLVWRGPFRRLPRALSASSARALRKAFGWLTGIASLAIVPDVAGWTHLHGGARLGMTGVAAVAVALTTGLFRLARAAPRRLERTLPTFSAVVFVSGAVLVNLAVVLVGSNFGGVPVFFVELLLMAFFVLRRPWAIALTVFTLGLYAVALAAPAHTDAPLQAFCNVLAAAVATGVLIGAFANRLDDARHALADMNDNLESRVAAQVDELERTGRLRRFLSPQIADVVTSEGADRMLAPHRADIAAFFVDLRGFTAFTNAVSAERVMRVLDEYYAAVGAVLDRHGATIGGFDGDGVFAYLGDPVAHDDAARAAIRMAQEVALRLDELVAGWAVADGGVGYGIGLAYGEATLGLVGFASRADYTPVGAVVNMAARLCADAKHGEIVVDEALKKAADFREAATRATVELKGFGSVTTYAVAH